MFNGLNSYGLKFVVIMVALLMLMMPQYAKAGGNIGFAYNQVVDDRSGGITGEYGSEGENVSWEVDGDLQFGDIYRAKAHAEIVFGIGSIGVKLATDITGKGYELDTIGRDQNVSLALTVPVNSLNFDVGVGGKSASPWGAPNALSDLVPKGYNEEELQALGLDQVYPAPRGLPFPEGSSLNVFVETGFDKWNINTDLKGVFQVTGEEKANYIFGTFETSKNLFGNIDATIGVELSTMFYQKQIYYESAILTAFGYRF